MKTETVVTRYKNKEIIIIKRRLLRLGVYTTRRVFIVYFAYLMGGQFRGVYRKIREQRVAGPTTTRARI